MDQMADFHFRTAVGGFHKGDVTDYITKTAAAHKAALQEKDQKIEALMAEIEALTARLESSELPEEAPVSSPSEEPLDQLELAAYRRAEAAERLAIQRSQRLYEALEEICQDTSSKLQSANAAAQDSVNDILSRMELMQETHERLNASLNAARNRLSAMDAMTPDPAEGLEAAE